MSKGTEFRYCKSHRIAPPKINFMTVLNYNIFSFKNDMLMRIFGPKRDEVTGGWRKRHNKELHSLYSSPSINRMIKSREGDMGRTCSTNGGEEECM
jgi:hypothetical protein